MGHGARGLALALLFAGGCEGGASLDSGPAGSDGDAGALVVLAEVATRYETRLPPSIAPSADMVAAFDPRLPGFGDVSLRFDARNHGGLECAVVLEREGGTLRALPGTVDPTGCEARWDGRDESGSLIEPGVVVVRATLSGPGEPVSASERVEIVRLGVREIQLEGSGRAALLYAAAGGTPYGYVEVPSTTPPWRLGPDGTEEAGATPLELADGSLRPLPEPWDDLVSPPLDPGAADGLERDTHNLPSAWVAGSTTRVRATFTTGWSGGVADPSFAEVRALPPDGMITGEEVLVMDGAAASFDTTAPLVPAVGRYEVPIAFRFVARRPEGDWVEVPGAISTTHRLYGLVAAPTFALPDAPHRAWVDVIDRVTGWVDGTISDPDGVAARIVEGVFYELGLQYDNELGASHYTSYPSGTWRGAQFNLTRFQRLDNGTIINCSDAASIVSTYANMMGIDLRYHIIQHRWDPAFALNYLYAIGRSFAASPFLSGRTAFRYHAITGPADARVFDATLALDGDGLPASPPHTTLLVQGLAQRDYLVALSPEWDEVAVTIDEKVRLR